jgi:hypothetical protein
MGRMIASKLHLRHILGITCVVVAVALLLRFKRRALRGYESIDVVERSSLESFPASDSPPWNPPGAFETR